jgi:phosphopantothenoylcysteine decarboxylase/phosphopantothenate--cysteine ligase
MAVNRLEGRHIVLGVTGSIAAYKAAEVARRLQDAGALLRVAMTQSATQFITPLTFETLTGQPVYTGMFDDRAWVIEHITWARWADVILIAPATANTLAHLAQGMADNPVTSLCLARESRVPVLVVPAMNTMMWQAPATQRNIAQLMADGIRFVEPGSGQLACREVGPGRLAEPAEIVEAVVTTLSLHRDLEGRRVLINAGPTREALDDVRVLTNPSTGKMGFALAAAAAQRGAEVQLVAGPTSLPTPDGVERIDVESAEDMWQTMQPRWREQDAVIFEAAVSDFRPMERMPGKVKKSDAGLNVTFAPTVDIAGEIGRQAKGEGPLLIGFAAESADLEANAGAKLESKRLDLIVANEIGSADSGFAAETNRARLIARGGASEDLGLLPKSALAERIIDWIAEALTRRGAESPLTR